MAIVDSVVMGKAKNKLGNVVFYVQNGLTIARIYNPHPLNPDTEYQRFVRNNFRTSVLAYLYLKDFLINANYWGRKQENKLNSFVRLTANTLQGTFADSPINAADLLSGGNYGVFEQLEIVKIDITGAVPYISINTNNLLWDNTMLFNYISFNAVTGIKQLYTYQITEQDYNNRIFAVPDNLQNYGCELAYISSQKQKKCSNLIAQIVS